jgi:hypothetical protein
MSAFLGHPDMYIPSKKKKRQENERRKYKEGDSIHAQQSISNSKLKPPLKKMR